MYLLYVSQSKPIKNIFYFCMVHIQSIIWYVDSNEQDLMHIKLIFVDIYLTCLK